MRTLALAAAAVLLASPALAQERIQDTPEANFIFAGCQAEMGYTAAECACLIETVPDRLTERQLEYVWVRASRDAENTRRMNQFVDLGERLHIFLTVRRAARTCAPGKPFNLPDSGGDAAEAAARP